MTTTTRCEAIDCSSKAVTGWFETRVLTPAGCNPQILMCQSHSDRRTDGQRIELRPRPDRLLSF